MFKEYLFSENGYGTVEFLLIVAASAVIAGAILYNLMPNLKNLHEAMESNIRDISNTGY